MVASVNKETYNAEGIADMRGVLRGALRWVRPIPSAKVPQISEPSLELADLHLRRQPRSSSSSFTPCQASSHLLTVTDGWSSRPPRRPRILVTHHSHHVVPSGKVARRPGPQCRRTRPQHTPCTSFDHGFTTWRKDKQQNKLVHL